MIEPDAVVMVLRAHRADRPSIAVVWDRILAACLLRAALGIHVAADANLDDGDSFDRLFANIVEYATAENLMGIILDLCCELIAFCQADPDITFDGCLKAIEKKIETGRTELEAMAA